MSKIKQFQSVPCLEALTKLGRKFMGKIFKTLSMLYFSSVNTPRSVMIPKQKCKISLFIRNNEIFTSMSIQMGCTVY